MLSAAATGSYDPSASFLKGTWTSLKPVAGWRSQEPWKVTYMLVAVLSNEAWIGALCAWKERRGATALSLHGASLKVAVGARTKCDPVLSEGLSVKEEGS